MTYQTPSSSIVCLAQPVRSALFRESVITGSSTVAERFRYLLDRSELLFQISSRLFLSWHWRYQTPSSSIVCLAQPVRSALFRESVITGSSTVAERFRYLLDRSELLFQISSRLFLSWHWRSDTHL
ncbi:hypothetical protein V6N13_032794 [Hibiscus sabdariffa]